jgi:ATP-dependent Clp protease ATP-binding subunit ClpB
MDQALSEAARLKDEYASAEHILIAMSEEKGGDAVKILRSAGSPGTPFKVLVDIRGNSVSPIQPRREIPVP